MRPTEELHPQVFTCHHYSNFLGSGIGQCRMNTPQNLVSDAMINGHRKSLLLSGTSPGALVVVFSMLSIQVSVCSVPLAACLGQFILMVTQSVGLQRLSSDHLSFGHGHGFFCMYLRVTARSQAWWHTF